MVIRKEELRLSAISIWETSLAIEGGQIATELGPKDTCRQWLSVNRIRVVPLDEEIALKSRILPFRHEDPADRFIGATAFCLQCHLAMADARLTGLPFLTTIQ